MIGHDEISKALDVTIPVSSEMKRSIAEWTDLYTNDSYWLNDDIVSLELASEIASETARLITGNGKSWISGSERADFLQEQYKRFMKNIRRSTEFACALGGVVFKPYLLNKQIKVESITADRFFPVAFTGDELTAAVFMERFVSGKSHYTRLEYHYLAPDTAIYTVVNKAFVSEDAQLLGRECSLADVPLWSSYTPLMVIRDVERPLFAYFRMPAANNIDIHSPLGMSCYKKAVEEIRQADQHWERIQWEYQGSELAVMADTNMFKIEQGKPAVPKGKKRLFRLMQSGGSGDFFKEFSPVIRDQSLFNGFNRILQRIEYNCDLAYGTISDPQTVEKTAEEVRFSKDRSRSSMEEKQKALQDALEHLVWIFNEYADYYKIAPPGKYEMTFEWGEGVAVDVDKEFDRQLRLVTAGKLKAEKLIAWYFGCSEEEAAKYIPDSTPLFD